MYPKPKPFNKYLKYSGLAFQMFGVIALAVWGGMKLDKLLKLKFPAFTITFVLLGLISSFIIIIKSIPKE